MNYKKADMQISTESNDEVTDHALIFAYAKGDARAFDVLYNRHKKALLTYLFRQSGNSGLAEDLAHDVWLAVIKQSRGFQPSASFKTWLYRIAHNRLVDHWRKHGHAKQALLDELSELAQSNNELEDHSSDMVEIEQLLTQLADLSAEQTAAMLLKIEGFSYSEIANITDSKQETVKSRLRYATQHLRLSMEAN